MGSRETNAAVARALHSHPRKNNRPAQLPTQKRSTQLKARTCLQQAGAQLLRELSVALSHGNGPGFGFRFRVVGWEHKVDQFLLGRREKGMTNISFELVWRWHAWPHGA